MKLDYRNLIKLIICIFPLTVWSKPYLTVSVDNASPYVQQSVIYTISLHSSGNVKSVKFNPPKLKGVSFERLTDPQNHTYRVQSKTVFVTDIRYLITAVTPGKILIPSASADITLQQASQQQWKYNRYPWANQQRQQQAATTQTLTLNSDEKIIEIQPVMNASSASLWLPLEQLNIQTSLKGVYHGQQQGEIVINTSLSAIGGKAKQLPSIAHFIDANLFKSYCYQPHFFQNINQYNKLQSQRTEVCTLIPKQSGKQMITLNIPWWNSASRKMEYAYWQSPAFNTHAKYTTQTASMSGASVPIKTQSANSTPLLLSLKTWQVAILLLVSMLSVMTLVWAWLFKVNASRISCKVMSISKFKCCLTTRNYDFSRFVPRAVKMKRFRCQLDHAKTAAEVNHVLCDYLCQNDCSGHSINKDIMHEFSQLGYHFDQTVVTNLFSQLENAQYGTETMTYHELANWKKEFYHLFSRCLFKYKRKQPLERACPDVKLPALNPGR